MKKISLFVTLPALALLLSANCFASDKMEGHPVSESKTKVDAKNVQKETEAKRKAAAQIKLVDINTATKSELKTLPNIGDAEADKIIAGRPYGSKAWLATKNILAAEIYDGLSNRVIAKQPYKDSDKNAQLYAPKK